MLTTCRPMLTPQPLALPDVGKHAVSRGYRDLLVGLALCCFMTVAPADERGSFLVEIGIELVDIPGGRFRMGASEGPARASEGPAREVEVHAFRLMKHEVTVGQYRRFVEAVGRSWEPPPFPQGDDHPVVYVSRDDALAFAEWLSEQAGVAFRLPSEAEWEYAARAGDRGEYPAAAPEVMCDVGNVDELEHECEDGYSYTAPVGSFPPNGFGVHDLTGNVAEWVSGCWHEDFARVPLEELTSTDTQVGTVNCGWVYRGGHWRAGWPGVRFAYRNTYGGLSDGDDTTGFRLVAVATLSPSEFSRQTGIREADYRVVEGPDDCLAGHLSILSIGPSGLSVMMGARLLVHSVGIPFGRWTERGWSYDVSSRIEGARVEMVVREACFAETPDHVTFQATTVLERTDGGLVYTVRRRATGAAPSERQITCRLMEVPAD